ncbi:MAG: aminotransferase class I/II-fold pyridoxal phosphate-dependent enzyme [Planctomycetes bacterium]|nr:aminotransferase class I/II-fold pyridoxal phosphate-dependent enzyme [Planctomycetota bacterium]
MPDLLDQFATSLEGEVLVRHFEQYFRDYPDLHMKDMTLGAVGPDRKVNLNGRWVVNFGSDSFLGLDQDPRLKEAIRRGLERWGTHNGTSRAFSSVASCVEAERKLAAWLKVESTLIYPSVTLTNAGVLPALVTRHDAIVADQQAHHSVHEGLKLAHAGGAKTGVFAHDDPNDLERVLKALRPYRQAIVAVDGIFNMSGTLPPLAELRAVAEANDAILYVDDAHGTGILGEQGRGTVLDALGDYRNTLVVGSLSKGLSCFGGFVACPERLRLALKIRSGPLIFGGPVPPPYLDAVCAVIDILDSPEYPILRGRLSANMRQFLDGLRPLGLHVLGGVGAIVSVVVGDELATLRAGRELFDRGYFVQSIIFPAVPHHSGVLRVQINANHRPESIVGLVAAFAYLAANGCLLRIGNVKATAS